MQQRQRQTAARRRNVRPEGSQNWAVCAEMLGPGLLTAGSAPMLLRQSAPDPLQGCSDLLALNLRRHGRGNGSLVHAVLCASAIAGNSTARFEF